MRLVNHKLTRKLALIVPFYGAWPVYFQTYLDGLARQETLDVHFFTDLKPESYRLPNNAIFHHKSFSDLAALFSSKLGIEVALKDHRKLCDLRPSYGFVFSDFLVDYEYWAFGDIDVLYGDLDAFLIDALVDYDVVSFREEWLSGSLTVLRNSDLLNNLFRKSGRWESIFSDPRHFAFDETCGVYGEIAGAGCDAIMQYEDLQSFTFIVRCAELDGLIRVFRKKTICESLPKGMHLKLCNGRLTTSEGQDLAYYHYITEKGKAAFEYPAWSVEPDVFCVDRYGFYLSDSERNGLSVLFFLRWHGINLKSWIALLRARVVVKLRKLISLKVV